MYLKMLLTLNNLGDAYTVEHLHLLTSVHMSPKSKDTQKWNTVHDDAFSSTIFVTGLL
jgi:hypothetical protein